MPTVSCGAMLRIVWPAMACGTPSSPVTVSVAAPAVAGHPRAPAISAAKAPLPFLESTSTPCLVLAESAAPYKPRPISESAGAVNLLRGRLLSRPVPPRAGGGAAAGQVGHLGSVVDESFVAGRPRAQ